MQKHALNSAFHPFMLVSTVYNLLIQTLSVILSYFSLSGRIIEEHSDGLVSGMTLLPAY